MAERDMTDIVTNQHRSELMRKVKRENTGIEVSVRRLVHSMGYRYRLHAPGLPGTPDIVFPGKKKAIFVHGCYWHHHEGCKLATTPKTNTEFWQNKFCDNTARDERKIRDLEALGWKVLVVWQCETKKANLELLEEKIRDFLEEIPVDQT